MAFTIEDVERYYTDSLNGVTEHRFDPYGQNYHSRPFDGLDIVVSKAMDNRPVVQWLLELKKTVQFNDTENPRLLDRDIDKRMFRYWGQVFHNSMFGLLSWSNYLKDLQVQNGPNLYLYHLCQSKIRERSASRALETLVRNNKVLFPPVGTLKIPFNFSLCYFANLSEKLSLMYEIKTLTDENRKFMNTLHSKMVEIVKELATLLEKWLKELLYSQNTINDDEKWEILRLLLIDSPRVSHINNLEALSIETAHSQQLPESLENLIIEYSEYRSPLWIEYYLSRISSIVKEVSNKYFGEKSSLS